MTKLWGKPRGMWTQMVPNFHIFKFHTTQFSHITHVTLKPLSHTQPGISCTCSFMSSWRTPTAAPPANPQLHLGRIPSFSIPIFCAYFIASCHYYLQRKQERNSKRHSLQPCLVSITFLHSLRLQLYSCFCFMHAIASQIYRSVQISVSFQVSSAFRVIPASFCFSCPFLVLISGDPQMPGHP